MVPASSERTADRLHHIDNLRAFVMSIGVLVHAGEIYHFWLSWVIHFSSGLFRMKLFILIAGYFVGLLHVRRGMSMLMKERLIRFGIPILSAVLVLNPIAIYFYLNTYVGPIGLREFITTPLKNNRAGFAWGDSAPIFITWHLQIWFIITVLIFCVAMPVAFYVERSRLFRRWSDGVLSAERRGFGAVALALTMAVLAVATRAGHLATTQQLLGGGPFNFLAQTCWLYAPYFVFGIAMFHSERLFEMMHRVRWIEVLLAGIVLLVGFFLQPIVKRHLGFAAGEIVEYFYQGFVGVYISIMFFALFRKFASRPNATARYLSEASYTIYIFQMAVLASMQYVFLKWGMSRAQNYFISIALTYIVLLAIHRFFVDTNPLTRLLFNGKPWWRLGAAAPKTIAQSASDR